MAGTMTLYGLATDVRNVTDKMLKVFGWSRDKLDDMFTGTKADSLTKQAAGTTCIFPVIITADIPVQAASLITQMLELEYANYLTFALASSPKINIHDINDGKYLRQYHTNLSKLESILTDAFDPDEPAEAAFAESIIDTVQGYNVEVLPSIMNHLTARMQESMEPKNKFYGLEWLMEASPAQEETFRADNDRASRLRRQGRIDLADDLMTRMQNRIDSFDRQHAREREERQDRQNLARNILSTGGNISSETRNWINWKNQQKENERQRTREDREDERAEKSEERAERKEERDVRKEERDISKEQREINKEKREIDKEQREIRRQEREEQREEEQTIDSHITRDFSKVYTIKKINDEQPTPVVARLFSVDNNGTPSRQIEVVCGVKAKLHQINKKELITLLKSEDPGNLFTTIVRFTSGELNFFSDVLLGNNSIKEYAAKSGRFSSNGAKVLATLKRVKDLNRTGKTIKPNATLIVSKASVDELKRVHGIDLLDEDDATIICDRLSLIKLIISDPIAGKLHILMPGYHDSFSVVSTDTLEKQVDATQDAALTKELRKIVSKGA